MNKPRGFIFGGFVNGLGLVRSLAKEGIKSDVFDIKPCLAAQSRFASYIQSPSPKNEEEFIQFVIERAQNQSLKPICFITNDHIIQIGKYRFGDWEDGSTLPNVIKYERRNVYVNN